jgi:hypothetical protein
LARSDYAKKIHKSIYAKKKKILQISTFQTNPAIWIYAFFQHYVLMLILYAMMEISIQILSKDFPTPLFPYTHLLFLQIYAKIPEPNSSWFCSSPGGPCCGADNGAVLKRDNPS